MIGTQMKAVIMKDHHCSTTDIEDIAKWQSTKWEELLNKGENSVLKNFTSIPLTEIPSGELTYPVQVPTHRSREYTCNTELRDHPGHT